MKSSYTFKLIARASLFLGLFSIALISNEQIVTMSSSKAGAIDKITLMFNAALGGGELKGASKVYIHLGVVTDSPSGMDWKYVKGTGGNDEGDGLMTKVPGDNDTWLFEIPLSARHYFSVPSSENIFRIAMRFHSADGAIKATFPAGHYPWGTVSAQGEIYLNLHVENYLTLASPKTRKLFVNSGEKITVAATASTTVSEMTVWIDEQKGTGFDKKASVSSGKTISYDYMPTTSGEVSILISATVNGLDIFTQCRCLIHQAPAGYSPVLHL